jgi:fatty acid desaturase
VNPSNGPEDKPAGPGPHPANRPAGIVVVAAVAALEAAALLAAAGWYGFQLVSGAPVLSFWGAVFTLGLLLAFSAWLFAVGHFLFHGYRWPRAGALVAQLFMLTIGFPTLTGGYPLAGLAMLLPAAVAIVLLFDKRVIAFASRTGGTPPTL